MHSSVDASEAPKRRLRSPETADQQSAKQANARMLEFLDNDFDWDSRIPIPVGNAEESHETGRMLFNIGVDGIVDIADPIDGPVIDGTNQGAETGDALADESDVEAYIVNGRASPQQTWFALTMEEINGQFYRGPCGATMVTREWAPTSHGLPTTMARATQGDLTKSLRSPNTLNTGTTSPVLAPKMTLLSFD